MPKKYDEQGISFQYPDNWELEEENDHESGVLSATVFSPGGAFWSVIRHPQMTEPEEAVLQAVDALSAEYDSVERHAAQETVGDVTLDGYDLGFIYLDLTNTVRVRGFRGPDATIVLYTQAEDRELAKHAAVFAAMTQSLVDSLY
ncbi:MAG: hypothetical protein KDA63_04645 [Planctomycetales bacterium]|nr:hypothetical protein [Planctomycetales bacterium]